MPSLTCLFRTQCPYSMLYQQREMRCPCPAPIQQPHVVYTMATSREVDRWPPIHPRGPWRWHGENDARAEPQNISRLQGSHCTHIQGWRGVSTPRKRHFDHLGRAEEVQGEASEAHPAADDEPGVVDAVDTFAEGRRSESWRTGAKPLGRQIWPP